MNFRDKCQYDPLAHPDAQFINVLYCTSVGRLMEMDKERLRGSLAKARLVCHWLQGILDLLREQEACSKLPRTDKQPKGYKLKPLSLSLKMPASYENFNPQSEGDQ